MNVLAYDPTAVAIERQNDKPFGGSPVASAGAQ